MTTATCGDHTHKIFDALHCTLHVQFVPVAFHQHFNPLCIQPVGQRQGHCLHSSIFDHQANTQAKHHDHHEMVSHIIRLPANIVPGMIRTRYNEIIVYASIFKINNPHGRTPPPPYVAAPPPCNQHAYLQHRKRTKKKGPTAVCFEAYLLVLL